MYNREAAVVAQQQPQSQPQPQASAIHHLPSAANLSAIDANGNNAGPVMVGNPTSSSSAYSSVPRYLELLEALRKEFEASFHEAAAHSFGVRGYREDLEQKLQGQINEALLLQRTILELERSHSKAKQHYEEEIYRLRREIEARGGGLLGGVPPSSFHQQSPTVAPGVMPSIITAAPGSGGINGASPLTATLPQIDPARKRLGPAEPQPPISTIRSPNAVAGEDPSRKPAPVAIRKEGPDWVVIYNPKVPKVHDIDLCTVYPHVTVVCCVRFSPDNRFLATGSNKLIQVFDVASGQQYAALFLGKDVEGDVYVRSLSFSPDSKFLASGSEDKLIRIWSMEKKDVVCVLSGHEQDIYSVEYSSDAKYIVSGSGDRSLRIWNTRQEVSIAVLVPEGSADCECGVTSISISSDCKLIAAGCIDRVIRLWDFSQQSLIGTLEGHADSIYSTCFSASGTMLVSGSLDKTIRLWTKDSSGIFSCKNVIAGHKDFVLSVTFTPDEQFIVSGSKDRTIQIWDTQTCTTQLMLQGHKNSVISLAVSSNGVFVASGSGDFTTKVWSLGGNPASTPRLSAASGAEQQPSANSSKFEGVTSDTSASAAYQASRPAKRKPAESVPEAASDGDGESTESKSEDDSLENDDDKDDEIDDEVEDSDDLYQEPELEVDNDD